MALSVRALAVAVAVAALLALALSVPARAETTEVGVTGLSFNGTKCSCTKETYNGTSSSQPLLRITARCEKAFANSPAPNQCMCGTISALCVVNPTTANQGINTVELVSYAPKLCDPYCVGTTGTGPVQCAFAPRCEGPACEGKARQFDERETRHVTAGVSAICTRVEEIKACSTPAPCHCVHERVLVQGCTPLPENPCRGLETYEVRVLQEPSNGGNACPSAAVSHEECELSCDRDCAVSNFGSWGACNTPCGDGTQTRTRQVTVTPRGNGASCPPLSESRACTGAACPVNCTLSAWTNGPCDAQCGQGSLTRTRTVVSPAQNDGHCDGVLSQVVPCENLPACPVDCVLSEWSAFSACPACGASANKTRTRTITTHPANSGSPCGALTETVTCGAPACPVDCVVTSFTAWGQCSAMCGGGVRTRQRIVVTQPAHGGAACPPLVDSEACNTLECACSLSEWSAWGSCSADCGGGLQSRTRQVLANPGGAECAPTEEMRACNPGACPVNCETGEWSAWSQCTEVCGGGERHRTRAVVTPPQQNGTACGPLAESEPCGTEPCPVACQVGPWSDYGACSSPCGGGTMTRTRPVTAPAQNGGAACPILEESTQCNVRECAGCSVGAWGAWSACSSACGAGTQARNRSVTVPPEGNRTCDASLHETRPCDAGVCPCDCLVGEWTEWTPCSEACGEHGESRRTRPVVRAAVGPGHSCPALNQTRRCNVVTCESACEVSQFGAWGECSAPCGGGVQTRARTLVKAGAGSSPASRCPALTESRACNTGACPAPATCVAGEWGAWEACTNVCGGGTTTRRRQLASNGTAGSACPLQLVQTQPCNDQPCAGSCELGSWSEWSACSSPCGGGLQSRARPVATAPTNGGTACDAAYETRECNAQTCGNFTGECKALPPKCHTDECHCHSCCGAAKHGEWGACVPHCSRNGEGFQTRVRACPTCPDSCAPHHEETRACQLPAATTKTAVKASQGQLAPVAAPHASTLDYSHCPVVPQTSEAKVALVKPAAPLAPAVGASAAAAVKGATSPHMVPARVVAAAL